ncbi:MAG: RNA polymerase sigma factor [Phycisphaerales bacterium]|nr:MAG: RNA polymerase sigma factor [Phycisphaerales bacterium]
MGAETEKTLVASCQRGDRAAYEGLVGAHSGRIFAICLAMLGDRHDAEDMAQQTLLRGFMQITNLRNSQRFGAWIAQIARNLCLDTIRRRNSQVASVPFARDNAHEKMRGFRELEGALAKLSQDYRMPLLLFYFNGRSTKSIAETLGISQAAVQTRLSRARKKLRDLLVAEDWEP